MDNQQVDTTQIAKNVIQNLKDGNEKYYFYVPSTPQVLYFIHHTYQVALRLKEEGKNVVILHADKFVTPTWSDLDGIEDLEHVNISEDNVVFEPQDFIIAPEREVLFLQEIVKNRVSSKLILLVNSAFDSHLPLGLGASWKTLGVNDIIVTNETSRQYFESIYKGSMNIHYIPVGITDTFKDSGAPKELFVSLVTRDRNDAMYITKQFYTKYPSLRFVTMYDLRNKERRDFAQKIERSAVTVWVDRNASLGTTPIECYKTNTPLIGYTPELPQPFHKKGCGIWVDNVMSIPDTLAKYIDHFVSGTLDKENENGNSVMDNFAGYSEFSGQFTVDEFNSSTSMVFDTIKNERIQAFEGHIQDDLILTPQ